jgi:hypothetical protein
MTKQLLRPQEAQAKKLEMLPSVLLKQTPDAKAAVQLMIGMSDATHEALGDAIGKAREQITRFANGNGGLGANDLEALINECGNVFFLQFLADRFGFELRPKDVKEQMRAELLAKLQELENAA